MILSIEAATISSMSASAKAESVGFTTNSPFILATRTSEIGPLNGISDTIKAADAAKAANASGLTSFSTEINETSI